MRIVSMLAACVLVAGLGGCAAAPTDLKTSCDQLQAALASELGGTGTTGVPADGMAKLLPKV
jgi:hypothetical protein